MKTYVYGSGCIDSRFLTSALVGGKWSASRPGRFTPRGKSPPGTIWIGDWVGPQASLDNVEKRKFLTIQGLNSGPSAVQLIARRYTDYAIPAPIFFLFGGVGLNPH
jgi:hypothetical protein